MTRTGTGTGAPLEGVRVVEVAGWMAAPGAAALMADMGADVVKVEPLRGDPMRGATRQPDPASGVAVDASFTVDNRGKRDVAVAINRPEGAELVRRLAADADVFVTNLLPGRQERYGLDAARLHEVNPRLVHASLSGYGPTGPDAERAGYDLTAFFGRGAILDAMTEADADTPPRLRPAQGDHTAALSLLSSILAALRLVATTGEGQVVDVNLLATATWTMSTDLAATLVDRRDPAATGRRSRPHALHGAFRCADRRWLVLFMPEPRWWEPFCDAVGHPEWVDEERFATPRARTEHMGELTDLLDAAFATRTLGEWGPVLDGRGLIWGPASTLSELAGDPQAAALGLYPTVTDPDAGTFRTVGAPIHVAGADIGPRGPAPAVGAHTREVLTELGLSDDDVAGLVADRVVAA